MSWLRSSFASRTGLLFLTSLLLAAANEPCWLSSTAILLPPISDSLSTPAGAWQAPLALAPEMDGVARWPWLAYAVFAASIITSLSRLLGPSIAAVLLTFSLSLTIEPLHVVPAAALLAFALADGAEGSRKSAFVRFLWIGLGAMLALLGTLEFGLVLFVAFWMFLDRRASTCDSPSSVRRNRIIGAGGLLLVVGWALLSPGFRDGLLRPVNWAPAARHPELLRKLSPSYHFFGDWEFALLLGSLALSWVELARGKNTSLRQLVPLALLTILGAGCLHYLWLATFAVAILGRTRSSVPRTTFPVSVGTACAFACALVLFAVRSDWTALVAGDIAADRIDPFAWNLRGPVVLLNLEESTGWQAGDGRNRHRLVIDDRWDIHGDSYDEYALACHDLCHARAHSYLRTDGSWGGYARWLKSWQPIMLVANPGDDVAIRRLSLSPDWRVMGMDGQRVIFGRSGDPTTLPVMNAALKCLLTLEWPANVEQLNVEATIVAPTPADRRRTAGVLCAMRLPYAALRFLRGDDSPAADWQRTACYVELAHRIKSHCGTPSLLDQFRAVSEIRRQAASSRGSVREHRRLAQNLISLGLNDLSRELFPEESPARPPGHDVEPSEGPAIASATVEIAGSQSRMRMALAVGDDTACRALLAELSERDRSYYSIFVNATGRSAEEIRDDFGRFLSRSPDLDAATRAEALFYQGCAALEAGDTGQAILALSQSEQLAPNLPQRTIRRTFLHQLAGPGKT